MISIQRFQQCVTVSWYWKNAMGLLHSRFSIRGCLPSMYRWNLHSMVAGAISTMCCITSHSWTSLAIPMCVGREVFRMTEE